MSDYEDWGDEASTTPYVPPPSSSSRGGGGSSRYNGNDEEDSVGYGGGRGSRDGGSFRGRGRGGRGGGGGYQDRRNDDESRDTGGYKGGSRRGGGYGGVRREDVMANRSSRGGRGFVTKVYEGSDDEDRSSGFRGRGRGGRGRGGQSSRRYGDDDDEASDGEGGFRRGGGGRGRGRGRGRGGFDGSSGGDFGPKNGEAEPTKPGPVTYIPPNEELDEKTMFDSAISSGINFSKYDDIPVRVTGENPEKPILSFEQCGLSNLLLDNIKKSGYKIPTPIQKNAIPNISANRDLMACAQTGSGKTAAFLIPILNYLITDSSELVTGSCCAPKCVIVSPTRELAIQIYEEARKFAYNSVIKVALVYGGVAVRFQASKLMNGCHILVGTPGRLNDFVQRDWITFSGLKYFVLDEADRMLDLGFLSDIEKMMDHTSMPACGSRVTLMFSATFPKPIQELAGKYLNDYLFLTIGIIGGACSDVEQRFYEVSKFDKREKLIEVMMERKDKHELTLVFVALKRSADFIAVYLCEKDFKTTSIHGDRYQQQREEALRDFKSGRMPTLIATGVASRGLDIKNVAHVINYDLPPSVDEYVHRIGRTGRLGNRGLATSFYDPSEDSQIAPDLVKILQQAGQEVPSFLGFEMNGGNSGGYQAKSFGGHDIRKNVQTELKPVEDEEEW